jgi:hypothetical protein
MNKKPVKKLSMSRETLRVLVDTELEKVQGGARCETRLVSTCSTYATQKSTCTATC